MATAEYILEYVSVNTEATAPTEIYVPYVHYPGGYRVTSSDGHCTIEKRESYDIVKYVHDVNAHKHRVIISPRTPVGSDSKRANAPLYLALAVTAVAVPLLTLYKRR
ncbi:hypothetical protein ON010_g13207 [Phytophthora cinnamomi]|nr:hypothetical protein ON010_g13207 [Phytophthora cinnamomi]